MALGHTAADDQREQVGAADSEDAPDGSSDQPFEADHTELPFEQDDRSADDGPNSGITKGRKSKGGNFEAGNGYNDYKKKTYKDDIHGKPPADAAFPWYVGGAPVPVPAGPTGLSLADSGRMNRGMNRPASNLEGPGWRISKSNVKSIYLLVEACEAADSFAPDPRTGLPD